MPKIGIGISNLRGVKPGAISAPDTTPDAFSFTPSTNRPTGTIINSPIITPVGYTSPAPISISGGGPEYLLGSAGGVWTSSPGTISPGDTVRVRIASSPNTNTKVSCTLNIGGTTATFDVTTRLWAVTDLPTAPRIIADANGASYSGGNLTAITNTGSVGGSGTISGTPNQGATLNSKAGIDFNASGDKVGMPVGTWSGGVIEFFIVVDLNALSTDQGIFGQGVVDPNTGVMLATAPTETYAVGSGHAQPPRMNTPNPVPTTPCIIAGRLGGSNQYIEFNGTNMSLSSENVTGAFPNITGNLDIGEAWGQNLNGVWYYGAFINYEATTTDRQKMVGYLASPAMFNLQSALDASHPYKSVAP